MLASSADGRAVPGVRARVGCCRKQPAARVQRVAREEHAMGTNHTSFVYVGLAGETAPGRVVKSGLYRMAAGDDRWELVTHGLPEAPAIRAIATNPHDPATVYVGTQHG